MQSSVFNNGDAKKKKPADLCYLRIHLKLAVFAPPPCRIFLDPRLVLESSQPTIKRVQGAFPGGKSVRV